MRELSSATSILAILAGITVGLAARSACAQQTAPSPASQISVSGSAEVMVPPAKACFSIGVLTSAQSAAVAAEDNAGISKAELEALERTGLKHHEITGSRLKIFPRLAAQLTPHYLQEPWMRRAIGLLARQ